MKRHTRLGFAALLLLSVLPARAAPNDMHDIGTTDQRKDATVDRATSRPGAATRQAAAGAGTYFDRASVSFAHRDFEEAARDLRNAARLLDRDARRADAGFSTRLRTEAQALRRLAHRVLLPQHPVTAVDREIARASHVLAQWHYLRATSAWTAKKVDAAGAALATSAQHAERGLVLSGAPEMSELREVIARGDGLGRASASNARRLFETSRMAVAEGIEKLGHAVGPAPRN